MAASEKFPDQLPTADLADMADDYNPRKITDQKFAGLRKSLRKYGHVQ